MLIHAIRVSTTKPVGPHAARTISIIAATGASSAKNAKHALPLPLIRGANPNFLRNSPNSAGNATNFSNAARSILLKSNASAGNALSAHHAATFASASDQAK